MAEDSLPSESATSADQLFQTTVQQDASQTCRVRLTDAVEMTERTYRDKTHQGRCSNGREPISSDSTSSDGSASSSSDSEDGRKKKRGPMGQRRRLKRRRDPDKSAQGDAKAADSNDGVVAGSPSVLRQDAARRRADVKRERLPGLRTWKLIVEEKLLSGGKLRERLLEMWTLIGVIAALVASFTVDGITNSASSFTSYGDVSGRNASFCVGESCVTIKGLYKVYGALVSTACVLSIVALAMSILLYSYLLIHPVSRTRWFVRENVSLFPATFVLVILSMSLVVAGVAVQCIAAFGEIIGYSIVGLGSLAFVFIMGLIVRLEMQTTKGLERYEKRRRHKAGKQSMADVVSKVMSKASTLSARDRCPRRAYTQPEYSREHGR